MPDLAEALARTALDFQSPTSALSTRFYPDHLAQIQAIARYKMLTIGGGVPIAQGSVVVGAIGVNGAGDQAADEAIARAALA